MTTPNFNDQRRLVAWAARRIVTNQINAMAEDDELIREIVASVAPQLEGIHFAAAVATARSTLYGLAADCCGEED